MPWDVMNLGHIINGSLSSVLTHRLLGHHEVSIQIKTESTIYIWNCRPQNFVQPFLKNYCRSEFWTCFIPQVYMFLYNGTLDIYFMTLVH